MTITIESEWDEGDLVLQEILVDAKSLCYVPTKFKLYYNTQKLLDIIAEWQKEQNKKET